MEQLTAGASTGRTGHTQCWLLSLYPLCLWLLILIWPWALLSVIPSSFLLPTTDLLWWLMVSGWAGWLPCIVWWLFLCSFCLLYRFLFQHFSQRQGHCSLSYRSGRECLQNCLPVVRRAFSLLPLKKHLADEVNRVTMMWQIGFNCTQYKRRYPELVSNVSPSVCYLYNK